MIGDAPDYVVLVVEHVERSVDFYTRLLGLRLGHRSGPYAQLDTGTTRVALYEPSAMAATLGRPDRAPDADAPACALGIKVDD
ncbi:MAG TPA: VOC family protein, partial [Acidimicrobiia bacterium]|nr:VOC family protein [Acidimicrobiia bacterium]